MPSYDQLIKRNLDIPDNGFGIDIDAFGHLLGEF